MSDKCNILKLPHHTQQNFCHTRPPYRQGKRLTSVKVYTVNDESKHLMISGVPKLQLNEEVRKLVEPYGLVKKIHIANDYPSEEFTEAYYVQYARIQSARIAKRFIDGKNFYGGLLHVFYLPELETITDTRSKLLQRRRDVIIRIKRNQHDILNTDTDKFIPKEQYHRKKKTPALPLTEERLNQHFPGETLSTIYDGIPRSIDPRPISEPNLPSTSYECRESSSVASALFQAPYHPAEAVITVNKNKHKRKNYKGQYINNNAKVRIVRPQLVDTSTIVEWNGLDKNVFSNPKKIQNNITIKLIPKNDSDRKRIIIKDSSVSQLVQPSEHLQISIKEAKSQIRASMELKKPK